VNLGSAQVYLKLMIDGVSSQPFSATTMPPIAKPDVTFKDAVIRKSREQFAQARGVVEKVIADWHEPVATREARPMTSDGKNVRIEERRDHRDAARDFGRDPLQNAMAEKQKVDENRQAFARIAEELKQKEHQQDKQKERQAPAVAAPERSGGHRPKTPAPTDQHAAKKNPSKENVSHLKNALADVLSKARTEAKPEEESEARPAPNPHAKTHHRPAEKPVEKPAGKIVEKETPEEEKRREVPEDVLKKLLSMDDAK
jgi:hypothetical protein